MTNVERLVKRLRKEGWIIHDGYEFRRTRAGYWQRAAGAWSWVIWTGTHEIGSQWPVADCLKAKRLVSCADYAIIPEDK